MSAADAAGARGALPGIDMLRGLAVLAVVCSHLSAHLQVHPPWIGRMGGLLGVELFFIISGYLILQSCSGSDTPAYLWRRAWRIFPTYWVVVLALTFTGPVGERLLREAGGDPWQLLAFALNLIALSHLFPPALAGFDVTTVAWSLTVEWFWYLCAPLVALAWGMPGRIAVPRVLTGLALAVAISVAWVVVVQAGWLDVLVRDGLWAGRVPAFSDFHRYAYLANAFPGQLAFFAAGAALAALGVRGLRGAGAWWLAGAAVLITLPWADRLNQWLGLHPSPLPALGLTAIFLMVCSRDPRHLLPSAPSLSRTFAPFALSLDRLGQVSYPLYLVHVPVMLWLKTRWPGFAASALGATTAVLLACALAALLHRLVETPGMRIGRRSAGKGG